MGERHPLVQVKGSVGLSFTAFISNKCVAIWLATSLLILKNLGTNAGTRTPIKSLGNSRFIPLNYIGKCSAKIAIMKESYCCKFNKIQSKKYNIGQASLSMLLLSIFAL